MQTTLFGRSWMVGVLFVAATCCHAQVTRELGIDRSNLARESASTEASTLAGIQALHVNWFRDVIPPAATPSAVPQAADAFVAEVKLAKQNHLKYLVNVTPNGADFPDGYQNPNAGPEFQKLCGWSQGSGAYSQVDTARFSHRLRTELRAVKAAGLELDAFEIGNEVNWICFNGDVPNGHAASTAEYETALNGYARFLKAAAAVIREPGLFPEASLLTFGINHASDQYDNPPHHLQNPAGFVARLHNLDGFDYLDNPGYHVDAYATHLYTGPGDISGVVGPMLRRDAAGFGADKPLWVTEWGFSNINAFPGPKGETLNQATQAFLATFDRLAEQVRLGPEFFYSYNGWLVDASGTSQPQAQVLSTYARRNDH